MYRDKVPSMSKKGFVVGVYVKYHGAYTSGFFGAYFEELLLGEMSPKKADTIIKLWNEKDE